MDIVKLLLKSGADLTVKDADNKTVLHRATESQNKGIVSEILRLAPFLKDVRDNSGKVPADYASTFELVSLFK